MQHLRLPLRLHRGDVHKASRYSTWVWHKKIKIYKHRSIVSQTGGENLIHLPPLIKYPMYDEDSKTQVRNISYYYYFARVFNQISALFPSSSRSALWPWWHQWLPCSPSQPWQGKNYFIKNKENHALIRMHFIFQVHLRQEEGFQAVRPVPVLHQPPLLRRRRQRRRALRPKQPRAEWVHFPYWTN